MQKECARKLMALAPELGDKERALDQLEKDAAADELTIWLKFEPCYDSLRDEPRFKALLLRAGLEQ